jgi:excisionase family DNA binding protein
MLPEEDHRACGPRAIRASDTSVMDWPAPLTVREVAVELGCSEDEVRALIRAGELQTVACGIRPGLVPRFRLDDYLRRHPRILEDSVGPAAQS